MIALSPVGDVDTESNELNEVKDVVAELLVFGDLSELLVLLYESPSSVLSLFEPPPSFFELSLRKTSISTAAWRV